MELRFQVSVEQVTRLFAITNCRLAFFRLHLEVALCVANFHFGFKQFRFCRSHDVCWKNAETQHCEGSLEIVRFMSPQGQRRNRRTKKRSILQPLWIFTVATSYPNSLCPLIESTNSAWNPFTFGRNSSCTCVTTTQ